MSQESAITNIENGTYDFYVSLGDEVAWVKVIAKNGKKYIRTQEDDSEKDNLLNLPECR